MIFNSSLKKPIAVNKQRSIANVRPATPLLRCPPVRNAAVPAPAPAPQKGSDAPADAKVSERCSRFPISRLFLTHLTLRSQIVGNVLPIPNTTITKADAPKVEVSETVVNLPDTLFSAIPLRYLIFESTIFLLIGW